MIGKILFIIPPMIMTDVGTYQLGQLQGHIKIGASFDTETLQIVSNIEEECST